MKSYKSKFSESLTPTSEMTNLDEIQYFIDSENIIGIFPIPSEEGIVESIREEIDFPFIAESDIFKAYAKMIINGKTHYIVYFPSSITPRDLDTFKRIVEMTDDGKFEKIIVLITKSHTPGEYNNWSSTKQ